MIRKLILPNWGHISSVPQKNSTRKQHRIGSVNDRRLNFPKVCLKDGGIAFMHVFSTFQRVVSCFCWNFGKMLSLPNATELTWDYPASRKDPETSRDNSSLRRNPTGEDIGHRHRTTTRRDLPQTWRLLTRSIVPWRTGYRMNCWFERETKWPSLDQREKVTDR